MDKLPIEIINNIYTYLNGSDLFNISLTSKNNFKNIENYINIYMIKYIIEISLRYNINIDGKCPLLKLLDIYYISDCYTYSGYKYYYICKIYKKNSDKRSIYGPDIIFKDFETIYKWCYDLQHDINLDFKTLYVANRGNENAYICAENAYIYNEYPSSIYEYDNIGIDINDFKTKIGEGYLNSPLNDKPACIVYNTYDKKPVSFEWYKNGKHHRDNNKPSIIQFTCDYISNHYYYYGKAYRTHGPVFAIVRNNELFNVDKFRLKISQQSGLYDEDLEFLNYKMCIPNLQYWLM